MTRRGTLIAAIAVVISLLGLTLTLGNSGRGQREVTAMFPSTVNLYKGAQVKVLGVTVGKVTDVEVDGASVRVSMRYDDDVNLPADVHAVIVPPSIVGDRFVQLSPAYTGSGATLPDGATIGIDDTAVPVELDETYRQLDALAAALGPQGANKNGSLSRLVRNAAKALDGNGRAFNTSITSLARALDTLADADPSYQGTVDNADRLTRTLNANDSEIRRLVTVLATVSGQLAAQRDDISAASTGLSSALDDLARFTRTHRAALKRSLSGLDDVSVTLLKRMKDLQDLLAIAPVGFVSAMSINLPTNYSFADQSGSSPKGRTTSYLFRGLFTGNIGVELSQVMVSLCEQAGGQAAAQLAPLCLALAANGNDLPDLLAQLGVLEQLPARAKPANLTDLLAMLRQGAGR